MQESVIYQNILAEALERVAINLLQEGAAIDWVMKVTGLSIERVQQLQPPPSA